MLTIQITAEEFKTLCEIVGRDQYRQSTSTRADKGLDAVVERLKHIAETTGQDEARRELF